MMGELSSLPNIGIEIERQLIKAGINSIDELNASGSEETWLRIQAIDSSACVNRLLALEGAIQGVKKTMLPEDRKAELKDFYQNHKLK